MDSGEFVNGESLESGAKAPRMILCYIAFKGKSLPLQAWSSPEGSR